MNNYVERLLQLLSNPHDELASQGQHGDNELVHVNSAEADLLERLSGNGSFNPKTGLRQFFDIAMAGGSGDPRGENSAVGGSIGDPTSLSGPGVSDLQAAIPADASSSGPSLTSDALTLGKTGLAAIQGGGALFGGALASNAFGLAKGIFDEMQGKPAPTSQYDQLDKTMLGPAARAGGALVDLLGKLGFTNEGLTPATVAPGAPDTPSSAITRQDTSTGIVATAAPPLTAPTDKGLDPGYLDYLRRLGIQI